MKKIFIITFMLVIFPILMVGCSNKNVNNNNVPLKLEAPTIKWDSGRIYWDKIDNASKYELSINGNISYTYNNYIELEISNNIKSYSIKVKSISESNLFLNSDFSNKLSFDTKKLKQPSSSTYSINNTNHLVSFNIPNHDYNTDYYEVKINETIHPIFKDEFILTETPINYSCQFAVDTSNFVEGENIVTFSAKSINKYYIESESSNILTLFKNAPYRNVRIEDGKIKYEKDFSYDVSFYDAIISNTELFPVINKDKFSDSISLEKTIWSDPVFINAYKIRNPKILSCTLENYILSFTLQGYDPNYAGSDKKLIGFDYDKIKIIVFNYDFEIATYTLDSSCLDIESFQINLKQFDELTISSISVAAQKDGYIDSNYSSFKIK